MKRVRPRVVQTATVKQSAAASTSPWAASNSRQVVRFLRSGAGSRPRSLAHGGEGAPRDLMPEVAAGTPNTGVAPLAVLEGHPDDEPRGSCPGPVGGPVRDGRGRRMSSRSAVDASGGGSRA